MKNIELNLNGMGIRELDIMSNLLRVYTNGDIPRDFNQDSELTIGFNPNSGIVYLVNEDSQVLLYNNIEDELISFYYLPYSGIEGTIDELEDCFYDDAITYIEDLQFLQDVLEYYPELQNFKNDVNKMLEVE